MSFPNQLFKTAPITPDRSSVDLKSPKKTLKIWKGSICSSRTVAQQGSISRTNPMEANERAIEGVYVLNRILFSLRMLAVKQRGTRRKRPVARCSFTDQSCKQGMLAVKQLNILGSEHLRESIYCFSMSAPNQLFKAAPITPYRSSLWSLLEESKVDLRIWKGSICSRRTVAQRGSISRTNPIEASEQLSKSTS